MNLVEIPADTSALDLLIDSLPNLPAVFLIWAEQGAPYLARTSLLRRRLRRLLGRREGRPRLLSLRETARRIEYQTTGSALESSILLYEKARQHLPKEYARYLRLRMPHYVKVILTNPFPRTQVSSQLASARALYYGPFRARVMAERFESEFLDFFQMRRCREDLAPSPEHPGCIYGEIGMCLRPCQQAVGREEYASEVGRVLEFLRTRGRSLLENVAAARQRLSDEMRFEEAARQHTRYEKIQEVLALAGELAAEVDHAGGAAITASAEPGAAELWLLRDGHLQPPLRLALGAADGRPVSLESRLRGLLSAAPVRRLARREQQEYLALLARWYYSSWRQGEWLAVPDFGNFPYRKLVNAVARVMKAQ
ncbi:MAG: hypothetical protein FJW37_01265 [Acidobacteria bacterium]|nr:hypothetical protein [Acidobacteriota bacterium]